MSKICLLLFLAAMLLAAAGCQCGNPGSREFIPGKGWTPN
jgi:hypothetical protein